MPGPDTPNRGYTTVDIDDTPANIETALNTPLLEIDADVQAVLNQALAAAAAATAAATAATNAQASANAAAAAATAAQTTATHAEQPIGSVVAYSGTGDPAGGNWMLADGRLVDKTTYADFFAAVGHAHNGGADPGSNKVRLPDYRGRSLVAQDNMGTARGAAGVLTGNRARGQTGGEEKHTLTVAELANHGHQVPQRITQPGDATPWDDGSHVPYVKRTPDFDGNAVGTTSNGGGQSHNNMQPYVVDNVIVRVK
jgi:microcystin-dependent protein